MMMMDLRPFKLDIDELIDEFAQGGSTKLAEMKTIWRSRKFSFMYEAIPCPSTNQACFMQSLFAHSIDGSATERVNELTDIQDARVQVAFKKLFANTRIEHFIHMDLGKELDLDLLKRKSSEYAAAKEQTIKEAGEVIDVQNIKHNTENKQLIGNVVEKTAEDWNIEQGLFHQLTGVGAYHLENKKKMAILNGKTDTGGRLWEH